MRLARLTADARFAERFLACKATYALGDDDTELLATEENLAAYLGAALTAHPNAKSVTRWLFNDLLGLTGPAGLANLPLPPAAFGRFVALVDAGRLTPSSGKALLASLLERAGEPEARMKELGIERVEDAAALDQAIARALEAQRAQAVPKSPPPAPTPAPTPAPAGVEGTSAGTDTNAGP